MSRNLAASVRARLKQQADATKQDFNLTLTRYGLERLLYRLSVSEYASNFLLKGALLFAFWYDVAHRPTRDADLLGFGPDDIDTAVTTFRKICQVPAEDGVVFDPDTVKGSIIRKEAGYGGVRIDLQGKLDGARIALQVDIGFGDAVTPEPQAITYPVLLEDFPAPQDGHAVLGACRVYRSFLSGRHQTNPVERVSEEEPARCHRAGGRGSRITGKIPCRRSHLGEDSVGNGQGKPVTTSIKSILAN